MLTDYYQITMAYAHFKNKRHLLPSTFQLFYRKPPFGCQGLIACGLTQAIDWMANFKFEPSDLAHLESLGGFDSEFLDYLSTLRLTASVKAVEEGSLVLPKEPILQITAPIIEAKLFESALLNIINFQSLIATKAALMVRSAAGDVVCEFGLRRAQGFDGALSASRAAYIGGCDYTSNFEAGKRYGIPLCGTMSHAWVMSYPTEPEAFKAYTQAFEGPVTLLVDTYDTINGIKNAVQFGEKLKAIRLDSGDLEILSHEARFLLNQAGLEKVQIIASGDLDEEKIAKLKARQAPIDIWGIGTRLVTAYDEPALGGVYKLARVQNGQGDWMDCHKTSSDEFKSTLPGLLPSQKAVLRPIFKSGDLTYECPTIKEIRNVATQAAKRL